MVTTYTERGPGHTDTDYTDVRTTHVDRGPTLTSNVRRVSWGAILAGTILVLTIQVMLGLLGLGIGLASIDPAANDTPSAFTLTSTAGIWAIVTVLIATFVGAWVAARLAGSPSNTDGLLHGIVTWALSTLVAVWLLTSGASAIISGAFGALGNSIQGITSAVQSVAPNSLSALPPGLEQPARQLLQQGTNQAQQTGQQAQQQAQQAAQDVRQATGEQNITAAMGEVLAGVQEDASQEERQAALQVISDQAGISEQQAEERLTEFQQSYDQAVAEVEQRTQQAADALSGTAFATFVALLLGLIAGAIGGRLGRPSHTVEAENYAT